MNALITMSDTDIIPDTDNPLREAKSDKKSLDNDRQSAVNEAAGSEESVFDSMSSKF